MYKKEYMEMIKKIYLETFKKCPGSLYFPLPFSLPWTRDQSACTNVSHGKAQFLAERNLESTWDFYMVNYISNFYSMVNYKQF